VTRSDGWPTEREVPGLAWQRGAASVLAKSQLLGHLVGMNGLFTALVRFFGGVGGHDLELCEIFLSFTPAGATMRDISILKGLRGPCARFFSHDLNVSSMKRGVLRVKRT
jgi:hypothetical protein